MMSREREEAGRTRTPWQDRGSWTAFRMPGLGRMRARVRDELVQALSLMLEKLEQGEEELHQRRTLDVCEGRVVRLFPTLCGNNVDSTRFTIPGQRDKEYELCIRRAQGLLFVKEFAGRWEDESMIYAFDGTVRGERYVFGRMYTVLNEAKAYEKNILLLEIVRLAETHWEELRRGEYVRLQSIRTWILQMQSMQSERDAVFAVMSGDKRWATLEVSEAEGWLRFTSTKQETYYSGNFRGHHFY